MSIGSIIGNVPLLILPYALYHVLALGGPEAMDATIAGDFFTKGNFIALLGIGLLYVEIYKATRTGQSSIVDHMFSMVLFIIALIEFIMVPIAHHSSFFLLLMIMLVDVVGGFTVTIRGARRDFGAGGGGIPMG